jgi:phage terminase small subunit
MGRPRKPSNVLELKGAFKHNPDRGEARADEPKPTDGLGDPPAHLSEEVRVCWLEIESLCHSGVLSKGDRLVMEHGSQLLAMLRKENWEVHPTIMIRFESVLGKLGMTPADRSKVSVIKPKENEKDPYAEFAAN